jgi:hypothetical protein
MHLFSKALIAAFIALPISAAAQHVAVRVPAEVKPFVESGMMAVACQPGDLNADGRKDYVLVLSKPSADRPTIDDAGDEDRPTLILIRDAANKLSIAARNDRVAYCKNCGGLFGDPFEGVVVRGTRFTITNYGGDADRWIDKFTFGYSRRDRTWQLVRVEESEFRVENAAKTLRTRVRTPPKSFGLIAFADFDPDDYMHKGK